MTNHNPPGRFELLLERIPEKRKSQLVWALVLLVGVAVMLPRLGHYGLWDPWEMRWAHMAQTMAEPARVLVLELPETRDGQPYYPLAVATAEALSGSAQIESSERYLSDKRGLGGEPNHALVIQPLLNALDQRVYHGLVLDSALWLSDGRDPEVYAKLADAIDNIVSKNPHMQTAVVIHDGDSTQFRQKLSEGWENVRSQRVSAAQAQAEKEIEPKARRGKGEQDKIRTETAVDWAILPLVPVTKVDVLAAEIAAALVDVPGSQWCQATFKDDGQTRSVPLLDRWLVALSYSTFGVNEFTTRIPFAVLGIVGLFLVYGIARKWFGLQAALWSVAVVVTLPLYFGQARNAAGELSTTVAMLGAVGVFGAAIYGAKLRWVIAGLLFFAGVLFLAKGLFALLALVLICTVYTAITLDLRRQVLIPLAALVVLFAVAVVLVLGADSPGIWTHFRFMNRLFADGPPKEWRTFDYFVRQVGFGLYPWSVFLPFALGRLVMASTTAWGNGEISTQEKTTNRLQILVVVYFTIPLAQWMFGIRDFSHLIYPAVPAAALATGLFLQRLSQGFVLDRFAAFVGFGILAMLFNDLRHSADPLFAFLATDPPFARDEKLGMVFPEEMKVGSLFSAGTALVILIVVVMFGRLTDAARSVAAFFRRPSAAMLLILLCFLGVLARVVVGLADRVRDRFQLPVVVRAFEQRQQLFADLALTRPEVIIGLVLVVALILVGMLGLMPRGRAWLGKAPRLLRFLGRCVAKISTALRLDRLSGQAIAMTVVGIVGIVLAYLRLNVPAGYGVGTTFYDPVVYVLCVTTVVVSFAVRATGDGLWGRLGRFLRDHGPLWAAPAFVIGLLSGYLALRFPKELWQFAPETWVVAALLGLIVLQFGAMVGRRSLSWLFVFAGFVGLCVAVSIWIPLSAKLGDINSLALPDGKDDTYVYLFVKSRATLGFLGLIILAVINWKIPSVPVLGRVATVIQRLGYRLEAGSVALPILALGALFITLVYNLSVVPALSFHVSQKHIVDTYHHAKGALPDGDNLFKHGSFAKANNDFNFYTNRVPEIADRSRMLDVLLRQKDTVARIAMGGGREKITVLPGWDEKNDINGDGVRDWQAESGLAEEVQDGRLVDLDKHWTTNQWKGYRLFDNSGESFDIVSNDTTSLTIVGKPVLGGPGALGNRYVIDHPTASVHDATAAHAGRNFFILPKRNFSELNYQFRKKANARHIPVLDDRSSQLILATGQLEEGEENRNWLAMHVTTEEETKRIQGFVAAYVNFEDKIALLGYTVEQESVKRREEVKLRIYFKALTEMDVSYKIFMHIDKAGSSNRIHSDHFVLNETTNSEEKNCVGCFQTNHWLPGDVVIDAYAREIPLGTPSGPQDMWMGFYNTSNDARLKVKDFDKKKVVHDGQNRVKMGTFMVR